MHAKYIVMRMVKGTKINLSVASQLIIIIYIDNPLEVQKYSITQWARDQGDGKVLQRHHLQVEAGL